MQRGRRRAVGLIGALALLFGAMGPAAAVDEIQPLEPAPTTEDGQRLDESSHLWFVELTNPPAVDGTSATRLKNEKAAFRQAARERGIKYTERFAFDTLWNGFSVQVGTAQLGRLSALPGVKAVHPVHTIAIPETQASPDLATALAMTGADVAQNELGLDGTGIQVAVMDTGIDYQHPDLGGCFGAGCRVAKGHDLVGDSYNPDPSDAAYQPTPNPDGDPDDCNGHGTHVAGIVGASGDPSTGGARGVAPGVTFGAYRVFGCEGITTDDIMMQAMQLALTDGMDILNMSIGDAFTWPQSPTAVASDNLVDAGMVVVASIGNSGASGVYSAGAPGLGEKVIGVASFDNSDVAFNFFTITPDGKQIGYANAAAAPPAPTSGSLPMARTGTATATADACTALPAGSLTGKAALIRRGTCTFYAKALTAQNAGAAAVVLYNNAAGRFSPTVAGDPPITIPVVAISDQEGVLIDGRLATGPVTMTWTDGTGSFDNPTGGLISSFSSYGLAPDLSLKPDIGAPGGLIRSTYPLEEGGYATISGTSMSSPHVAGAAALVLEARPGTTAASMRDVLQNSADPAPWGGNPGLGFLDNVHRQGAGMLDIPGSVLATTSVTPAKLALGESQAGAATRTLTIRNAGRAPVTYDLRHEPSLGTHGSTFTPSFNASFANVTFSASTVKIKGGGSATVNVTIPAPNAPDKGQYGGYIAISSSRTGTFRVPYAGFIGDYQSIVAMPAAGGLPALADLTACDRFVESDCTMGASYKDQPRGATFGLKDGFDRPYFLVHFDHQVRSLVLEVRDAKTGAAVGTAYRADYLARNSTSTGFFVFAWDGTVGGGQVVPDGTYTVAVRALKALGDASNPAHWESWTSPNIRIRNS